MAARNPVRVWVRKAQYNFGWDWAPRLASVGIWQDVTLHCYADARLGSVFFKTLALTPQSAQVAVHVELDYYRFPRAGYFYAMRAYAPVMASFKAEKDGCVSL